jgi:hypothetical protein
VTSGALPPFPTISGSVAQSAEQPVVCGKAEGASPFGFASFKLLPWPNYSGIRLLSGFMQVRILPTAPLPGGVKVARRSVKPFGVGASPTLAANFQGVMSVADGLAWNEEDAGAIPATLTISERQADTVAVLQHDCTCLENKIGTTPRSEHLNSQFPQSVSQALMFASQNVLRRLPPSSRSSKAERPADNRKTQARYLPGRPIFAVRRHPE